jgi:uncharacterized heparinase superfamily protein
MPPLWEFHRHYHEYLYVAALAATSERDRAIVEDALVGWLDRFEATWDAVAWHPYVISRRVHAWLGLLVRGELSNATASRVMSSLATQLDWLADRLERDIGGNHLWENARALAAAGAAMMGPDSDRWWTLGRRLMDECLAEQLLPWGEHFERSPGYHADLTLGLAQLADATRARDPQTADGWRSIAQRMDAFLDDLRHPGGELPLFGDSVADGLRGDAPTSSRQRSGWVGEYYIHQRGGSQLIFDAGNMGPDDLPAHAHADLLGYEMSWGGRRWIVDRGVYAYTGPERNAYRQTSAHNVLQVDGQELADVWSSFRMGRRGHVVEREAGKEQGVYWVRAVHDAYRSSGVPRVTRLWLFIEDGPWCCLDIPDPCDQRVHRYEHNVHWAPDVDVTCEGDLYLMDDGIQSCVWQPMGSFDGVRTTPTMHSERFYEANRGLRTCIAAERRGATWLGWALHPGRGSAPLGVTVRPREVVVSWQGREMHVGISAPEDRR